MTMVALCAVVGAETILPAHAQSVGEIPADGISVYKNGTHITVDWRDAAHATRYLVQIYLGVHVVDGLFVTDSILENKELSPGKTYTITATPYRDFIGGVEKELVVTTVDGTSGSTTQLPPVTTPDVTRPVLVIIGANPVTLTVGDTYVDAGATCTDDRDGSIAYTSTGTVNTAAPGTYAISYGCTDAAGNTAAPVSRTVTVSLQAPAPLPADITGLIAAITGLADTIENLTIKITALETEIAKQGTEIAGLRGSLAGTTAPVITDLGDFIPIYYDATLGTYNRAQQSYYEDRLVLENFTGRLTQTLALPYDVYVTMDECYETNAFYSPDYKTITICYELVTFIEDQLDPFYDTDYELYRAVDGFITWVALHELGHALVDVYNLPITGNEEDAVDQLATMIALEYMNPARSSNVLISTLVTWNVLDQNNIIYTELQLAGSHSLDSQRFYNIACWMYGSDVHRYSVLIERNLLPESRAGGCQSEYERVSESWYTLISPFLNDPRSISPP